ncbi:FRG domain-containing protein [Sideroxydans sp. CL21]|uniref:FRG domain-containing protein n=1 Tax=Sideroxydans sp. CL21 TaxID=2600596 RepID=UPI0012AA318A|nr:FRG domain-containing protein [Sideroxydans sp. CL21]VVC83975.1 hypothetical protein [Sideroxydans sp. CL21]
MTIKIRSINSVGDFLKRLKSDLSKVDEPVWFRGHSQAKWKLIPTYLRLKNPPPESVLISRFKQNANLLIEQRLNNNNFDWLFVMQHYGVPTRLLDWTESPLAGLYFAATQNPRAEASLWALFPLRLNQQTTSRPEEVRYLPSFDDKALENYSTLAIEANPAKGVFPMAVIATRNNARIQAQLGVFTISHHTTIAIESIGKGEHLIEYRVPASAKATILAELKMLAVTKFQLFPELSSVGELIGGELK